MEYILNVLTKFTYRNLFHRAAFTTEEHWVARYSLHAAQGAWLMKAAFDATHSATIGAVSTKWGTVDFALVAKAAAVNFGYGRAIFGHIFRLLLDRFTFQSDPNLLTPTEN